MDDSGASMKGNMEKVLRAMDVVPPFGSDDARGGSEDDAPRPGVTKQPRRGTQRQTRDSSGPRELHRPGEDGTAIPEFDLGERILAEQRRMTARKRRAPGSEPRHDSHIEETVAPTRPPLAAPSADDLIQLQRIVADIVARDIERLYTGPAPTPY